MDDLLAEFLTETNEFLETVDNDLIKLEADPTDKNTLNNIFRLVHTIKGTCGFLGLPRLQFVAHAGETLLGKFREGALIAGPDQVQLVLESIDRIKEILADLEATGTEPDGDDTALIGALERAAEGEAVAPKAAPVIEKAPEPEPVAEVDATWDPDLGRHLRPGEVSLAALEAAFMAAEVEENPPATAQEAIAAARPAATPELAPSIPMPDMPTGPFAEPNNAQAAESVAERRANPAARALVDDDADTIKGGGVANQSIRVNVDVLETLMTMVSELVLTRNQLMQMVRNAGDSEFKGPLQRLSAVTSELQDSVMKTRMQPIGSAWKKLPRIVRDAARDLGKKIDLQLDGEATELDRQVLELIKDPLTHMIRNSCDHGLETPADRAAKGKPETGVIRLNAYHEGGHIVIEVGDDGAGLNTSRIRDKAVRNGLVTEEQAWIMSDQQIHRFIFSAGLSTAQQVTNLSGRGVGMDVVRTNIELIGGTIDLNSSEGKGTTFFIKIPLTLAIVSALIVGAQDQRFAIPQLAVVELVGAGGTSEHRVETINEARVLRLRDRLLPLIDMGKILTGSSAVHNKSDASKAEFVVVMQHANMLFGVVVDEVFDTEEIVVKPLSSAVSNVDTFSGATILGDGSVIMIVDPAAMARAAGVTSGRVDPNDHAQVATTSRRPGQEPVTMVLFKAGGEDPKAVPLSLVTRLEELDGASFEQADGRIMVQYRGSLMPIVPADPYVAIRRDGEQAILVFSHNGLNAGIAVDAIIDIVEEELNIELSADRPGVLGVAVLKGVATEILDVGHHLTQAIGDWDDPTIGEPAKHVVLVERNPFFRNMLSPLLRAAGYDVEAVDTVSAALVCAEYRKPTAILADIDADPAAARRLLGDGRLGDTPVVAMSGAKDIDASDFAGVVRKSDRSSIISTIDYISRLRSAA